MKHPRKGNSKKPHNRTRKIVALRRLAARTSLKHAVHSRLYQELSR